ncbi:hypothetical protein ACWY4P_00485 [Streptomyces sp. LZ34]|uniref:hypothetical protein n=1 Tax=Streptomyces sp. NBC_00365 TaxID=2975726 RepID=UPI002257C700|nr:hypothetical protein [Streptomyces sp. NBC_00365]MCX5096309.1 hypothetical protein [Streptomyces sp. NBC_00365]
MAFPRGGDHRPDCGAVLGHLTAAGEDAENAAQRRAVRNGQPAPGDTTHQVCIVLMLDLRHPGSLRVALPAVKPAAASTPTEVRLA